MGYPSGAFTATVHPFRGPTPYTCAYEVGLSNAKNAVIFIGGLGDGPHTVPYPRTIAKRLEAVPQLSYSVFEFRLKSSFLGFGFSRLADDVADISALVRYLRSIGKEKVVLMGHSTGSQDCMEYTSPAHTLAPVEAYILQAPACDRDALITEMGGDKTDASVKAAKGLIAAGKAHDRMPLEHLPPSFQDTPISAWRWNALAAADGEDNYFDPGLSDETAGSYWKRVDKPILILHSGNDEYVSKSVDKKGLIDHWRTMCQPGMASELSGVIPEARHRVEEADSVDWLTKTVIRFLEGLE
ncbi:hypothetical protein F5Y15DRAFT_398977 [Xylariaceae sp. FL0016]|nr:hypothetical protein F5Y15DRAFT_398977 [Xylariaceae sp. FL0016]